MNNYAFAVTVHVEESRYRELAKDKSLVEKKRIEDQLQEILKSGPVSVIVYKDQNRYYRDKQGRLKHERT